MSPASSSGSSEGALFRRGPLYPDEVGQVEQLQV